MSGYKKYDPKAAWKDSVEEAKVQAVKRALAEVPTKIIQGEDPAKCMGEIDAVCTHYNVDPTPYMNDLETVFREFRIAPQMDFNAVTNQFDEDPIISPATGKGDVDPKYDQDFPVPYEITSSMPIQKDRFGNYHEGAKAVVRAQINNAFVPSRPHISGFLAREGGRKSDAGWERGGQMEHALERARANGRQIYTDHKGRLIVNEASLMGDEDYGKNTSRWQVERDNEKYRQPIPEPEFLWSLISGD